MRPKRELQSYKCHQLSVTVAVRQKPVKLNQSEGTLNPGSERPFFQFAHSRFFAFFHRTSPRAFGLAFLGCLQLTERYFPRYATLHENEKKKKIILSFNGSDGFRKLFSAHRLVSSAEV